MISQHLLDQLHIHAYGEHKEKWVFTKQNTQYF